MAVSENETSDCNSDSSVDGMTKERKEKPITKVIIRRLPPSMTKDTFLEQVSPLPDYDYMYFVKADLSLGEYAFSRAYINFKNSADIFLFKERFDNYVFLDQKGHEYTAVVEFAPFSRIPKRRNKTRVDPKCGTIESDPIYIAFVESLTKESDEVEEKPEYNIQPSIEDDKPKITNTPLLDYIKQRRIDRQKIREEKREERKRRELERKRYKEDERRRKTKPETYTSKHISKNVQILNSSKDTQSDDKRDDKYKDKDRKYEDKKGDEKYEERKHDDRRYEDRKYEKKYDDRRYDDKYDRKYRDDRKYTYSRSKEVRKTDDYYKKPPPKIKLRFEKTDSKTKPPFKKEDSYHIKKTEHAKTTEEEKTEKKVKKYSERREEHKNEIKKLETLKKDDKEESKNENNESKVEYREQLSVESKNSDDQNEYKENDPRTQRRIRNKDRPAMPIYQPGMGFRRNRGENNDKNKNNDDISKSDTCEKKTENCEVKSE